MKRVLSLLLIVAMLCSMAACGGEPAEQPTEAAVSTETAIYTVTVETAGGMMMPGLDVYIYADNTLSELLQVRPTKTARSASKCPRATAMR